MKKIYLVKKDANKPADAKNWLVMNSYEFAMFMKTPEGQSRKDCFGPLDACSFDDYQIFAECGKNVATQWRSEKDAADYLRECEEKSGIKTLSYHNIVCDDKKMSGEGLLVDEDCDIELYVVKKVEVEELHKALGKLLPEERKLIACLFLMDKPMSEQEYAEKTNGKQTTVGYQKRKILAKLKKMLQ